MSRLPYFKCFPSNFLNGIVELEPDEIAVYTVVIMMLYDRDGEIDDEPGRIAKRCNMPRRRCENALESLHSQHGKIDRENGKIYQKRVEKEIEKRQKISKIRKISANARWEKQGDLLNEINTDPDANAMQNVCKIDPLSRIQNPESRKNIYTKDILDSKFEEFWQAIPNHAARPAAQREFEDAVEATDPDTIIAGAKIWSKLANREDPKFSPLTKTHPARWLKKKRWQDDDHVKAADNSEAAVDARIAEEHYQTAQKDFAEIPSLWQSSPKKAAHRQAWYERKLETRYPKLDTVNDRERELFEAFKQSGQPPPLPEPRYVKGAE